MLASVTTLPRDRRARAARPARRARLAAVDRADARGNPRGDRVDRRGRNAGLLAARILGASDAALRARIVAFQHQLAETVRAKDAARQELHGKVTGE